MVGGGGEAGYLTGQTIERIWDGICDGFGRNVCGIGCGIWDRIRYRVPDTGECKREKDTS